MKFSIIIPCYKVESCIRACLDSILAQTVNDPSSPAYDPDCWEAICVDDGSPDATGAILDDYAAKDARIKVIHQANGGLSAARNAALSVAQGEWLYYLDGDDVLSPWALATCAAMAAAHPDADLLHAEMVKFEDGATPRWEERPQDMQVFDVSRTIEQRFLGGYFPQYVYRRSFYGDIPFVGLSWCEERPYFAKCFSRAQKVAESQVQCYGFRVRAGSITHRKMTLEEVNGYLDATRTVSENFASSGKGVGRAAARRQCLDWTEKQWGLMAANLHGEAFRAAWRHWVVEVQALARLVAPTLWFKFVLFSCRTVRCVWVGWTLCYLPHWLKCHGAHR